MLRLLIFGVISAAFAQDILPPPPPPPTGGVLPEPILIGGQPSPILDPRIGEHDYEKWHQVDIPDGEKGTLTFTKNSTQLKEDGGKVVHQISGHGFDPETWDSFGIHVILEFSPMVEGKVYEFFGFEYPRSLRGGHLNYAEVIGVKGGKIEFMIPTSDVGFWYTDKAPEFKATFNAPRMPKQKEGDAWFIPGPGLAFGKDGTTPIGDEYEKVYPQNLDGFRYVFSFGLDGYKEGSKFAAKGALADGDQLYLRNLKTNERIDVKLDSDFDYTLEAPPNTNFVLYFIGAPKPNRSRTFSLSFTAKE